jgi:hypothetical protein
MARARELALCPSPLRSRSHHESAPAGKGSVHPAGICRSCLLRGSLDPGLSTQFGRAPSRSQRRPVLQFLRSKVVRHRRGCSAYRSGFYANSVFGSKCAGAMPWFPRRRELFRHKSNQWRRSYWIKTLSGSAFPVQDHHRYASLVETRDGRCAIGPIAVHSVLSAAFSSSCCS